MLESSEHDFHQWAKGLEMAQLDDASGMSEKNKRLLREKSCPSGGGAEVIRNYDGPVKIQVLIAKMQAEGLSDERIFYLLSSQNLI